MRIISGEKKGLIVKAVPGMSTRPTADKVRESLFHIIGPYFKGGTMLDLYGGSGIVGLEALSRGMDKVVYVDKDPKAVRIIKQNLSAAGWEKRAEVYRNEAGRALKAVSRKKRQFDIVFLDPPYEKQNLKEELIFISDNQLLSQIGILIAEHSREVDLPEEAGDLTLWRQENYGNTIMSLYRRRDIL